MISIGTGARGFIDGARADLRRDSWLDPGVMAEKVKAHLENARALLQPSAALDDAISHARFCASHLADELEAGRPRSAARDQARSDALDALDSVMAAAAQTGPSARAKALGVD